MKAIVTGFTIVLDEIVERFGRNAALVYGAMMRYTDKNGICLASQEKIGKRIGLSPKSVAKYEQILEQAGLIAKEGNNANLYRLSKGAIIDLMVIGITGEDHEL